MRPIYMAENETAEHESRVRQTIQKVAVETNGSLTAIEDACTRLERDRKGESLSHREMDYMASNETKRQLDEWHKNPSPF